MNRTKPKIERIDEDTLSSLDQYTFPQVLSRQAERLGSERIAIREKAYGIWQTYDWREYLRYTKFVALGLISLGLKRGENVGLILDNQGLLVSHAFLPRIGATGYHLADRKQASCV